MTNRPINVFIVDDHPGTRAALRQLLEYEKDFRVCGEAGTVEEACMGIRSSQADVAIVDLDLNGQTGLDVISGIAQGGPKIPILILSMHGESLYAESCLQRGAQGYLMKSEPPDQILNALRQVAEGKQYVSPAMSKRRQGKGSKEGQ